MSADVPDVSRLRELILRSGNPIDAAMGRAGGHSRGSTIEVFEDTAARLRELCARQADCDLTKPDGAS